MYGLEIEIRALLLLSSVFTLHIRASSPQSYSSLCLPATTIQALFTHQIKIYISTVLSKTHHPSHIYNQVLLPPFLASSFLFLKGSLYRDNVFNLKHLECIYYGVYTPKLLFIYLSIYWSKGTELLV